MSTSDFATLFNKLCENSGKNNVQIAHDLNVDKATIGRWRSGERTPKLSKLNDIADYFNVDVQIFASNQNNNYIPDHFESVTDAMEFILRVPVVANNCGYDLDTMSEEEIIEMAEDLSEMLQIMAKKHRKK